MAPPDWWTRQHMARRQTDPDEGRCGCLFCDCEGPAIELLADDEAMVEVCPACAQLHPQEALEAVAAAR